MSTLNRAIAPTIVPIKDIHLLDAEHQTIHGVDVYTVKGASLEIIQLMLFLPAGRWFETKQLQALLTAKLLKEGTTTISSLDIHEMLDFYGASLSVSAGYSYTIIELTTLSKHLTTLLSLVEDVFLNPAFSEEELALKRIKLQQKLKVKLEKTDYLAQREFHNKMFGENHPYGYSPTHDLYEAISVEDLKEFHETNYCLNNGFVLLAGNITDAVNSEIASFVERVSVKNKEVSAKEHQIENKPGTYRVHKENAQQASIRVGALSIGDDHEDYTKLLVATTILGGYFGSRLMANIREDKGYTYGVYSMLGMLLEQPYFFISADVGVEHTNATLKEIYFEINRLQTELVLEPELQLVKNYLMGKELRKIDGTFAQAKVISTILSRKSSVEAYINQIKEIQSVTPQDILTVAKKYWQKENMVEVVAGV